MDEKPWLCLWLANWSLGLSVKTWGVPCTLKLGGRGSTKTNTFHMQFLYQLLQGIACSVEVKKKKKSIPLSWINQA